MNNFRERASVNKFNFGDSKPFVIIISGPTASGKTSFADMIAEEVNGEIINADTGQFYAQFSIGTAKPNWRENKIPQHLFDILDEPKTITVVEYKNLILNKISEIISKGKVPILVGGSLFYLKSLFFSPKDNLNSLEKNSKNNDILLIGKIDCSWSILNRIDPKRASEIHPNDLYRIERALNIWKEFGVKPSLLKPDFNSPFNSLFIFIKTPRDILNNRIELRTDLMFKNGWIEEVEQFIGTDWEQFFEKSGLIGYKEILNWIKDGKDSITFEELKKKIIIKTRQYAKRQITFWRSFYEQIELSKSNNNQVHSFEVRVLEIKDPLEFNISSLKKK